VIISICFLYIRLLVLMVTIVWHVRVSWLCWGVIRIVSWLFWKRLSMILYLIGGWWMVS